MDGVCGRILYSATLPITAANIRFIQANFPTVRPLIPRPNPLHGSIKLGFCFPRSLLGCLAYRIAETCRGAMAILGLQLASH